MRRKMGAVFLCFFFLWSVGCEKSVPFPTELLGKWVTDAPDHADRFIEIKDMQLIFGTDAVMPTFLFIQRFKKKEQNRAIEWTFHCRSSEDNPLDIILFYQTDTKGERLILKNKEQVVWTKDQE